jgi:hypothetical protein
MAIDPNIILQGLRPLPQIDPLQIYGQVAEVAALRDQAEARRQAGEERRQKAADEAAMRRVLTETGGDIEAALPRLRMISPTAALGLEGKVGEARKQRFDALRAQTESQGKQLDVGVRLLQGVTDEPSYRIVHPLIAQMSPEIATAMGENFDPARVQQFVQIGLSTKDLLDQRNKALDLFVKGDARTALGTYLSTARTPEEWNDFKIGARHFGIPSQLVDLFGEWDEGAPARAAQLSMTPEERATLAGQAAQREQTATHQGVLEAQGAERLAIARQRAAQGGGTSQSDADDVDAIADAIIAGDQPPTLTGLYRYGAPVRAALAKKGYNLANAQTDWAATQRHFATLNNPQQTRLRQAVDTALHSLDVIDDLAGKWNGGRYAPLNRANLALARSGVFGQQAASIAQQLKAQIADVTSELGNAYQGGNSPTDHALQLAAKNLSAAWSEKVLTDMTQLARTNLRIRQNAIRNVGVISASPQNPYVPPPPADPLTVTAPDGNTYRFKSAAEVAAFKRRAGIP